MENPNQYRKQATRLDSNSLSELEALKQEVKELEERNKKLQEELVAREEIMSNLFNFIESNNTK
ncbi:MAG: hypothetical protein ACOVMR_01710 [Flavobacteriales bacterium]